MVYLLAIFSDESWLQQSAEESRRVMEGHQALEDELRARKVYQCCGGLAPSATARTVRYRDGKPTVTDGPFMEAKEVLGGFYLVEADSIDQAVAWAQRIPGLPNRAIEVRPVGIYHAAA